MRYVGFDIGGTAIKAGLVDENGSILERRTAPTPTTELGEFVSTLTAIHREFAGSSPVAGVGIGVPGLVSSRTRKVVASAHVPCLEDVDLGKVLNGQMGAPVLIDNDANAAAYGEFACGLGQGLQHMACLTLGTGLGSGLIFYGRLFRGASGYAGEMGHVPIEPAGRRCDCGAHGCVETWVSASGMVTTAKELIEGSPEKARGRFPGPEVLTAEAIYEAAVAGDALALRVFEITGRHLGIVAASLMNLLNLQLIVVSGGVMAAGALLLEPAILEAQRRAFRAAFEDCPIVQSRLWPDAGVAGAAMLARDHGKGGSPQ
jgi:glucokinase